ncbi:hypothetical protein [Asaia spathodeae]|uniref:Uncharacterized protein n=1 Tax=Asaia spathodeae TaxID=657016 RepID=A0ABX2P8L8_9PROT|nr:hypothetical protein [Asaia spathodeae]GBR17536.1 hypothetical protein AA105894_1844 [Asaia spathodeae NBRC 105894]
MADTDSALTVIEGIGANIVPELVGTLLAKYEPNCDIAGAKVAVSGLVANAIALQKALDTQVVKEAPVNA